MRPLKISKVRDSLVSLGNVCQSLLPTYRKFPIKPPGGLVDFKHSRGGLIGEGGLIREGG